MDVQSVGAFGVGSVVWQPRPGAYVLTVIAKAAFDLAPIECPLSTRQEPPSDEEQHWDDDDARSVFAPTDIVPYKARAEVVLVGSAYSPRGEPVLALPVRLTVGELDKGFEVFSDRAWNQDGRLLEGPRFSKMSLRWERAAGGAESSNPVGISFDGARDPMGRRRVPNLQPLGLHLSDPTTAFAPVGFGPIAATWPSRRQHLGARAASWNARHWYESPLPSDVDAGFFQCAPRDQQLEALHDNERIVLENLHPEHTRLVTSLPGLRPQGFVERAGQVPAEVALRPDTLWIDTDARRATLTWRGQVVLSSRDERGRVLVDSVRAKDRSTWADVERKARAQRQVNAWTSRRLPTDAETIPPDEVAESPGEAEETMDPLERGEAISTLFLDAPPPAVQTIPFAPGPGGPPPSSSAPRGGLPFAAAAPLPTTAMEVAPEPPPPPPRAEPALRLGGPEVVSPWSGGGSGRTAAQAPLGIPAVSAPPKTTPRPDGLLGLSNNAADRHAPWGRSAVEDAPAPAPAPRLRRPPPVDAVKLLWFDPEVVKKVRRKDGYRLLLAEAELRRVEAGDDDEETGAATRESGDVFEVLARGTPADGPMLRQELAGAVDDLGRFESPLVMSAGTLDLPFDDLEQLRASVAAAKPFATTERKDLASALDVAERVVQIPGMQSSTGIVERTLGQLREAFVKEVRGVASDYLESQTERALLERRAYQKRTLFGKDWIRALFRPGDGSEQVVAYLPSSLEKELPLYRSFRARLLGELEMKEDQYETASTAMRVSALGRVLG